MQGLLNSTPVLSPATIPVDRRQRWLAIGCCLMVATITATLMPLAAEEWPKLPAFIPAYQTAVTLSYLVTAYLLFAQFRTTGTTGLVFLAGGSLYTALILIAQLMSFPGLFASQPLVSGGPQTTIWFWVFWHLGPPLYTLAYAVNETHSPRQVVEPAVRSAVVAWTLAAVGAGLATCLLVVTVFHDALPVLDMGGSYVRMNNIGVAPAVQALTLVALLVLWRATGFRTTLQVWMGVAMVALLLDNAITMLGGARFTVGWYVGRINALLSALVLLFVYVRHIGVLQDRLAGAAASLAEDKELLEQRVAERTADLVRAVEERQRAMVVAERATEAKAHFFASASHDLRQPFQSLRLYHCLLQQRAGDRAGDRLLTGLDAAISAGEELLHSVLAVSSLDTGVVNPHLRLVRLDEVLDKVVLDSRGTAEATGVSLRLRARPLWVETDPVLLKRAIRNLVANAIRYNRPNGRVLIGCRVRSGRAVVQVWDTGVGIPPDIGETIFEEYVQLGNPERDRQKGFGLGLAIVRRTAEVLGCDLTYRSAIGKGTVFSMAIALATPPAGSAATVVANTPARPLDDRLVLVVEDDVLQSFGLCQLFEGSGYRTHSVSDAHSALEFVATARMLPGVMVSDLRLPGDLNGLQLARRLHREANGRIPTVIVTGDTDRKYVQEAEAAGCRLLHKPYRPDDLCRAVDEALNQADRVRERIEVGTC